MLTPSAVILGVFVLYPLGRAVWLGQQRCDNFGNNCVSQGFGQYLDLFRSTEFRADNFHTRAERLNRLVSGDSFAFWAAAARPAARATTEASPATALRCITPAVRWGRR